MTTAAANLLPRSAFCQRSRGRSYRRQGALRVFVLTAVVLVVVVLVVNGRILSGIISNTG